MGKRPSLQKMVFEKLNSFMQKNETPQKCTLYNYVKNKKKVYATLKYYVNRKWNFSHSIHKIPLEKEEKNSVSLIPNKIREM